MAKRFDTHTHTNLEPLLTSFNQIYDECKKHELFINVVGTTIVDSNIAVEQAQNEGVYCTVGIHPNEVNKYNLNDAINELEALIKTSNKIIAIGECGLDYYYENFNKQLQSDFFLAQLKLALKYSLTLMCHIRNAHDDAITFLKKYKTPDLKVIIHCFSDNKEYAKAYLDLGCYLSIPGIVTFKKADLLKESLPIIPLDRMLTETDAPFLAPVPYRSKTNYPYYILETNKYIAQALNLDLNDLEKQLFINAMHVFNLN